MNIFYNTKSRSLKKLCSEKKIEIQSILANPEQLKLRNAEMKYRVEHAGTSLPIFSFQDGIGSERGSERVIYTYWDGHCIILDYVTAHDYQKVAAMNRHLMRSWFSALKEGDCSLVELTAEEAVTTLNPVRECENLQSGYWIPASLDASGRCVIPSRQQQHVAFGEKQYPLIVEGVAGSGKTLVLTLISHFLSQNHAELPPRSENQSVIYAYPNGASLLGEKMHQEWSDLGVLNEQSPEENRFRLGAIDEFLPLALQEKNLEFLKQGVIELLRLKKKQLSLEQKKNAHSQEKHSAWHAFFEANLSTDLIFDYLSILVVFGMIDPERRVPLVDLISTRGGLSVEIFQIIEQIYAEMMAKPAWQQLRQGLQHDVPKFDMAMIDESQNIRFIALAYILKHTENQQVIFAGDRHQATTWESVCSLELLDIFMKHRGMAYQREIFHTHHRCPADIWRYTQDSVLALKAQLFGEKVAGLSATEEKSSDINNAYYLKASEQKRNLISHFFDHVPELSSDCFVITPDMSAFDNFSKHYLNSKKLIVLSPNQAAGLEVKTVVVFNPINWQAMNQLMARPKQKSRSKNLSKEEQHSYEQLNHFYVSLTRSTETVLIIESATGNGGQLQQELMGPLKSLELIDSRVASGFSVEVLLDLYKKMGANTTQEGREFYQRYSEYLEPAIIKMGSSTSSSMVSQENHSGKTHKVSVGELITTLSSHQKNLTIFNDLSSKLIAQILFEPYGQKRKQSLWARLVAQYADPALSPTSEKNVWKKFLSFRATRAQLGPDFYDQILPEHGISLGVWLLSEPKSNTAHWLLTEELLEKSLETIDPSEPLPEGVFHHLVERYRITQTIFNDLSSKLIAQILFEPYGHEKKQSLWARLVAQHANPHLNPTSEKNLWKKFLSFRATRAQLGPDFYDQILPEHGISLGVWLLSEPKSNTAHWLLTKELLEKSLGTIDRSEPLPEGVFHHLVERYRIKQQIKSAALLEKSMPPLQQSQPVIYSQSQKKKKAVPASPSNLDPVSQDRELLAKERQACERVEGAIIEASQSLAKKRQTCEMVEGAMIEASQSKEGLGINQVWDSASERAQPRNTPRMASVIDIPDETITKRTITYITTDDNLDKADAEIKKRIITYLTTDANDDKPDAEILQQLYLYRAVRKAKGDSEELVTSQLTHFFQSCLALNPDFWARWSHQRFAFLVHEKVVQPDIFTPRKMPHHSRASVETESSEDLVLFEPSILKRSFTMIHTLYSKGRMAANLYYAAITNLLEAFSYYSRSLTQEFSQYHSPYIILLARIIPAHYFDPIDSRVIMWSFAFSLQTHHQYKNKSPQEKQNNVIQFSQESLTYQYHINLRKVIAINACHLGLAENVKDFAEKMNDHELMNNCGDEEEAVLTDALKEMTGHKHESKNMKL